MADLSYYMGDENTINFNKEITIVYTKRWYKICVNVCLNKSKVTKGVRHIYQGQIIFWYIAFLFTFSLETPCLFDKKRENV